MRCDEAFDSTQRLYMESFARHDAATFRSLLHPEAAAVLVEGEVRLGAVSVMAALASHFEQRVAACSWSEVHRFVDDCRAALIVYETDYSAPNASTVRTLRAITHVREQGRWLVVADQATLLGR
jgi:uncharacterized protein (TIGR02246 family)